MLVIFNQIHCELLKLACILLNNCSIDFDQTSVKSSRYIHFEKILKVGGLWGSNYRNGGIYKPRF